MSKLNDCPVMFALSNPTDHAECTAQEAYRYSKGKAIFAAGVQFDPVQIDGKTYQPSQANNFFIFPAVGLAIVATEAKRVPDEIFIEAACATADQLTSEQLEKGMLFPPQSDILNVSIKTAVNPLRRSSPSAWRASPSPTPSIILSAPCSTSLLTRTVNS